MSDGVPAEVSWLLSVMDGRAVPIGTAGSVLEVQVDEPEMYRLLDWLQHDQP